MSNINTWAILVIAVCAICTFLERALPFLIFGGRKMPETVAYLGSVLPMAIIATLVFYCIRNIEFTAVKSFLPQLLACGVTAGLHLWKSNTLLSIAGGTVTCMTLIQLLS